MNDGNFLATILQGIFKGKARDTFATLTRVHSGRHSNRLRIITHRDVVLMGNIEAT